LIPKSKLNITIRAIDNLVSGRPQTCKKLADTSTSAHLWLFITLYMCNGTQRKCAL